MGPSIFTAKADTLGFLQEKITKSKIEQIFNFTTEDWERNPLNILNNITTLFNGSLVIVRSSAVSEDTIEKSEAGTFASVLNVISTSRTKLKKAIQTVINSYEKKGKSNRNNQILIQKQTTNVKTSGVLFTKTPDTEAPYYIINFEDGKSTDSVTKGLIGDTIKIFRKTSIKEIPNKWKNLIISIREIEQILGTDFLDIEFAITDSNIVIFQVRPLTTGKKLHASNIEKKIFRLIEKNKKKYRALSRSAKLKNNKLIFSDMADWNPAEIIGNRPHNLDYSLYDYLVMRGSWLEGRLILGYQKISTPLLMRKFGNKPYIDVRISFNSLIPENCNKNIRKKLMNFYVRKFIEKPFLHDKVEFEILFTCYDTSLDSRLKDLENFGFSKHEIKNLKESFREFTNDLIHDFPKLTNKFNKSYEKLARNREKCILELANSPKNYYDYLLASQKLLFDCRKYGVIPFSAVARIAFVGTAILRGLKSNSSLKPEIFDHFLTSINTPLSEFKEEIGKLVDGKISKKYFLEKYGHLRPGTYDITIPRYNKNQDYLKNLKFLTKKPKKISKINEKKINQILENHQLKFGKTTFVEFVKQAITQREKLKFEFTKNISEALEYIAIAGEKLGFSREEMSNLEFNDVMKFCTKGKQHLVSEWKNKSDKKNAIKKFNEYFLLPPIIFSEDDFQVIRSYIAKPNYITKKQIRANVLILNPKIKIPDIENKIVVIENADPGYDWIFAKNPQGLITKYGGIASHMAIRCEEVGIPAVIGCGEMLFEKLKIAELIFIDCKNEKIDIIEYSKKDDYLEEKKLLKSLGYMK